MFSIFLKEERDLEFMTSLSSELKNLGPWKKRRETLINILLFDNTVDGTGLRIPDIVRVELIALEEILLIKTSLYQLDTWPHYKLACHFPW